MAYNILIVDDSSSMRSVIKKIVKASGFNVGEYLEASDGKIAMDVLATEWVDVVLTDLNMPNMNGLELLAEMKKDPILTSIPVVMVTTAGDEGSMKQSMGMGAKGYIRKPFMPEEIKSTLMNIMGMEANGTIENDANDSGGDF